MGNLSEIASWIEVTVQTPDIPTEIIRVTSIDAATKESAVFATDSMTLQSALSSHAGLILASGKLQKIVPEPHDSRLLWVRDARYAFSVLAQRLGTGAAAARQVTRSMPRSSTRARRRGCSAIEGRPITAPPNQDSQPSR